MSTPLDIIESNSNKLRNEHSRSLTARQDQASEWLKNDGAYFSHEDTKSMEDFISNNANLIKDDAQDMSDYLSDTSDITSKPVKNNVDISSEIIRANFTINYSPTIKQAEKHDTEIYLNNALNNLPEAVEFESVTDAIEKMPDVSKIIETNKTYKVPNWFKLKKRKSMEMRVKQLNRLSTQTAKTSLSGTATSSSKYATSLAALLKFESSSEEDEKEGFFQGGITLDELSQLRKKLSDETVSKGVYTSIADNKIISYDKYGFVTYNTKFIGKPFFLPRVILGNINVPDTTLRSNGDGGWGEVVREQFKHKIYNTSVEALLRKAPDFRQNMFLGMFVYTTSDGGQIQAFEDLTNSVNGYTDDSTIGLNRTSSSQFEITKLISSYEKTLSAYYVRMQNITVPGISVEPYELKFLNRTLKKITPTFTEQHKMTINVVLDEMGLMVRNFNLLTGQFGNQTSDVITDTISNHNKFADTLFPAVYNIGPGQLDLVVTYNDFRINENNGGAGFHSTSTAGKVVSAIKSTISASSGQSGVHSSAYMPAMQNVQSELDDVTSRDGSQTWGDPAAYRQFIFEDVKVLGFSSGYKFNRDNSGRMTVPLDIIFRRVTTVDNNASN